MAQAEKTNTVPAPPAAPKAGNAAPAAATTQQPASTPPTPAPKKKRVSTVDPNETNEQKVVRLGKARVLKAVNSIRQIGNLAAYKPTTEQVQKIVDRLTAASTEMAARLRGVNKQDDDFSL